MNRFLTTVAVIGLLAAPAWAQTVNSPPANSSTMSPPAAGSSSDIDQSKPSAMPSQGVTRQGMSSQANDQDQASPAQAAKPTTTRGSGSSAPRHMARAKSRHHAEDNNADALNQQELQHLSQSK